MLYIYTFFPSNEPNFSWTWFVTQETLFMLQRTVTFVFLGLWEETPSTFRKLVLNFSVWTQSLLLLSKGLLELHLH